MDPADNISAALPQAPPPRAEARSAAIGAALERYDEAQRARRSVPAGARGWWPKLLAPQYAAFAAVAVVAIVSLPRLETAPRIAEVTTSAAAPVAAARDETSAAAVPAEAIPAPPAITDKATGEVTAPLASRSAPPPPGIIPQPEAPLPAASPPAPQTQDQAPAAVPPAPAMVAEARPSPEPAHRFADSAATVSDDGAGQIIVTAQRRRAGAVSSGDPWTICTVDDPQKAMARCRRQIDAGAPGTRGRAGALLADGLTLGWNGDLGRAIEKFDQTVALTPRSAPAYLNRALVRQRRGETVQAASDFDLAVHYGGDDARTYYFRARFRREQGDVRGAARDERRAGELADSIGIPPY